jgi:putative transposase
MPLSWNEIRDRALAFSKEWKVGLYKTEVSHHRGPWRGIEAVEYATLEWVDWFINRQLLAPIGNVSPAELEMRYLQQKQIESAMSA